MPCEMVSSVELRMRLLTAGLMIAVASIALAFGRVTTLTLVTVIVLVSGLELFSGFGHGARRPTTVVALVGSVAVVVLAFEIGARAFPIAIAAVLAAMLLAGIATTHREQPLVDVSLAVFGFLYVGCLAAFAGLLLGLSRDGVGYLLGVFICAAGDDSAAYFVGSTLGRHLLAPRISPKKTVEGLLGGTAASLALGAILGIVMHPWARGGVLDGLALGAVVAVTAPVGDLCESMIKRGLGMKDFGRIPGHGGVLDVFDSVLLSLPAVYYLARYAL
jgi:phosphatidate cytidylyltransferase